jgi:hypothetical protein
MLACIDLDGGEAPAWQRSDLLETTRTNLRRRRVRDTAGCVKHLCGADQTYVCLWSHAGWRPVHIHFVVQPAWNGDRARFPAPGPSLQAAMFDRREQPPPDQVVAFCNEARSYFAQKRGALVPSDVP